MAEQQNQPNQKIDKDLTFLVIIVIAAFLAGAAILTILAITKQKMEEKVEEKKVEKSANWYDYRVKEYNLDIKDYQGDLVTLIFGTINGQNIDADTPVINVEKNEKINGSLFVTVENVHGSGAIFVVAATPSWGNHRESYWKVGSSQTGKKEHRINIDLQAPSQAGQYYIIVAGAATMNATYLMSETHWKAGTYLWDNGYDVADWDAKQVQHAIENSWAPYWQYDYESGEITPGYYGATAVKINVN